MTTKLPHDLIALDAGQVGELLGQRREYVLDRLAKRPDFPRKCSLPGQHPRWVAGEVLAWREANRASPPTRRRSRGNSA